MATKGEQRTYQPFSIFKLLINNVFISAKTPFCARYGIPDINAVPVVAQLFTVPLRRNQLPAIATQDTPV
ncbi:hypothetical protein, partial [Pseudomonas viridiflava]|uniref:hypothetical protein n=1 Tax=Pseudomonas viridiflava TaxID=33069 RepID=UPI0019801744